MLVVFVGLPKLIVWLRPRLRESGLTGIV